MDKWLVDIVDKVDKLWIPVGKGIARTVEKPFNIGISLGICKQAYEKLCQQKYPPNLSFDFVDKSVDIVDNFIESAILQWKQRLRRP